MNRVAVWTITGLGEIDAVGHVGDTVVGDARAYERGASIFSLAESSEGEGRAATLVDNQGQIWEIEEEALVQVDDSSQRLERLSSHNAYWFGWYAFHPTTELYDRTASAP